jgi:hypothetical protein
LELVVENFQDLYNIMLQDGHIPDDKLLEMGFPMDLDNNNRVVERNAEISQEPYQRAKILYHKMQKRQREKRLCDLHEEKICKINVDNHKRQKILDINKTCEEKLLHVLGRDCNETSQLTDTNLMDATLQDFANHCKANELTAFCRVRLLPNESNSIIPTRKGKIDDALNGDENLIVVAHRLRNRQPKLQLTKPPPLETLFSLRQPVICRFSLPNDKCDPTRYELSFLTEEWLAGAL